jgi:hypothetical protein
MVLLTSRPPLLPEQVGTALARPRAYPDDVRFYRGQARGRAKAVPTCPFACDKYLNDTLQYSVQSDH